MNAADLRRAAAAWLAEGRAAMLVSVDQSKGSVPREAGTRMVVGLEAVLGTLGGGHLELKAVERARALLLDGAASAGGSAPVLDRYALGPSLGQCCGGAVVLRSEPLSAAALAAWPEAEPRFTLWLYGAGHVGRAIAKLLVDLDCRVCWIDEREEEWAAVARSLPEVWSARHIERVCTDDAAVEALSAPPQALHLVMTHRHDLDLRICSTLLQHGAFAFLGVIGSETKATRFRSRLRNTPGIDPASVERMVCPIGMTGLPGKEPPIIAVSVVAQLLHQSMAATHRLTA